ncbi:hypothetical protein PV08_00432 [Exophiala spinifera]|uniref:Uncharacterized protein n=1 Tax=Exophiala spinifera TaxID=91928 RepID=A0A0D2A4V4_9EURO|nr:uncharacterized protein PV08_00432 [Exophiala spinifera]KIW19857.1 hypothetical protein PV08_00432 [Exophiala spinifera]
MSYPQESFIQTSLLPGSLLARRREVVSSNTLLYQLEVLKKTGRYDAFKLKWHPSYSDPPETWPIPNHLFWDSDIGKWIEGACYFLHKQPDTKIHSAINDLVKMIRSAQQPDGYINIHYTVVEPGKRFTNLRDFHELYNAGHLIEAALAHNDLYKNGDLLEPLIKYVDLLCRTFGPGKDQIHGYPGHPEIELALLRLYQRTKDPKHLDLARYFITERGNPAGVDGRHYYVVEAEKRGDPAHARMVYWGGNDDALWYYQAHKPIVEQETIEGHSVRAMYLLTAASDLVGMSTTHPVAGASEQQHDDNTRPLQDAIYRLWDNMVERKMYVTGGIGAIKRWEGFGLEYFLPQSTDEGGCYAETCAAIGVMMLAERILQYDLDRRFGDVMELCLYNAMLTSMSHDGTKFTYVNQLASSDADASKREEWFTCACCPPNVLRLFGQIGGYVYSDKRRTTEKDDATQVNVHLYVPSRHEVEVGGQGQGQKVVLTQTSNWPWDGRVEFEVQGTTSDTVAGTARVSIALRIPAWAKSWKITPSTPTAAAAAATTTGGGHADADADAGTTLQKGYLILSAHWVSQHPKFTLDIDISPRLVSPHPYTNQDTVAVARGPVVYVVEDVDNAWVTDHFKGVQLDPECSIRERTVTDGTTGDTFVALTVPDGGASILPSAGIHASPGVETGKLREVERSAEAVIDELHFVPYYFRANRGGRGQARVGLRRWRK